MKKGNKMPILSQSKVIVKLGHGDVILSSASEEVGEKTTHFVIAPSTICKAPGTPLLELEGVPIYDWSVKIYFEKSDDVDRLIRSLESFKAKAFIKSKAEKT